MTTINLGDYDAIAISISGGKDSQTIIGEMMSAVVAQSYGGKVIAIHADTGAEWPQSLPHCQMLCEAYGIELAVATPLQPLPDHIEARCRRMHAEGRQGGWPSMSCRYCTSDCKRNPIQKIMRNFWPAKGPKHILSVTGERREESPHRAKLDPFSVDKMLTAGERTVTCFRPILDFTLDMVWHHIAATGLPRHPAYDLGNKRLSCAMCVVADDIDLINGAKARPDLAERFLNLETETGMTFRHKQSLRQILNR